MRKAFIGTLSQLADQDPRIVLLTGDLGFMVIEEFAARHPDRFINVGVAEQNMMGLATGLAQAGMIPFVYSITPFAVFRPFEFLRNGPCYHNLPVRIIGVGAGVDYGTGGFSHHAREDIAVLRTLPNLRIETPQDDNAAAEALRQSWHTQQPVYYRIAKSSTPPHPAITMRATNAGAFEAIPGSTVRLIVFGAETDLARDVCSALQEDGVDAGLIVVTRFENGSVPGLSALMKDAGLLVSIENHGLIGGLGSVVAEALAEQGAQGTRLVRCGLDINRHSWGSPDRQLSAHGLDREALRARVLESLDAAWAE